MTFERDRIYEDRYDVGLAEKQEDVFSKNQIMTLRILYTAFDVVPSSKGASRHITAFTRSLVEGGHAVTLMTAGIKHLPAAEPYAGAQMIRVNSGEGSFLERTLHFSDGVWEHLREKAGAYDVIHFRDIWSGMACLDARERFGFGYKTIFEVNGLPSVELKYHYPSIKDSHIPRKLNSQEQNVLSRADEIICVSKISAIYLQSRGADQEKITTIPNGIDPNLFFLGDTEKARAKRLIYAGTLASWQGIATLIKAMPVIIAAIPDVELHLIGPYKKRHKKGLAKLTTKLGLDEENIRFLDPIPPGEIHEYLRTAAVCLAPLGYNDRNVVQGCCPIKILEYAALAKPIVASDLPVVRELLQEDEAFFFQADEPIDLAQKIIHLLSHPDEAKGMGVRAAAHVRGVFTWEIAGERLLAVYAKLTEPAAFHTN